MTRPRSDRLRRSPWFLLAVSLLPGVLASGCGQDVSDQGEPSAASPPTAQVARAAGGMVSAAQPLATQAGIEMLQRGGNAADAALAAAFAISVVEPSMNSIGGRNQILVRMPDGEVVGIDGTTQAPSTYDPATAPQASYGYPTVGVPGAVAGLFRLYREFGSLPIETIMEPAIRYAEEGFELLPGEAARHASAADQIREFPGSRDHFLEGDTATYRAGELFRQPNLAATLRALRDQGPEVFYQGDIARRMAEDIQANGGAVTLESLNEYRAEDAIVVRGSYRGYDLAGSYVPAASATTIQVLQVLEHFDMGSLSESQWAAVLTQALWLAFQDYAEFTPFGDREAAAFLTSKERAAELAAQITVPVPEESAEASVAEVAWASEEGASSAWTSAGAAGMLALAGATGDGSDDPTAWMDSGHHTTHLSTADASGMMVALTQTIGPNMGSKVATPGLGFLYAATLGGYLGEMEPGERARSAISPLVISRDGEPFMVLGGAGGGRIPPAVIQTVLRVIDGDMSLGDALAAPRLYARRYPTLDMETTPGISWSQETLSDMVQFGYTVTEDPDEGEFGRVHAILWDREAGEWVGGADPDWEGSAGGPGR